MGALKFLKVRFNFNTVYYYYYYYHHYYYVPGNSGHTLLNKAKNFLSEFGSAVPLTHKSPWKLL
jgi:hypothetical protein